MTADQLHIEKLPIDWERFCAALRLCPELARAWTEYKRLEALSQAGGHSAANNDAAGVHPINSTLNTASLGK